MDWTNHTRINWRGALEVATSIALLAAAAVVVEPRLRGSPPDRAGSELRVPTETIQLAGAATKGSTQARYALVEFSDFECPFCGRFAREVLPVIEGTYVKPGSLLLVFKHLPLPNHQMAEGAAVAAECAGRQGHFWTLHDLLFSPGASLDPTSIRASAIGAGVKPAQFDACVGAFGSSVKDDAALAAKLGINGTPSFFFGSLESNGTEVRVSATISGARPVEDFVRVLRPALRK